MRRIEPVIAKVELAIAVNEVADPKRTIAQIASHLAPFRCCHSKLLPRSRAVQSSPPHTGIVTPSRVWATRGIGSRDCEYSCTRPSVDFRLRSLLRTSGNLGRLQSNQSRAFRYELRLATS